jgi:hypothetical protein
MQASLLPRTAKGMLKKQVLAWWLRQRTTVGRQWVCERLGMGEVSSVTRAMRAVRNGRDAKLARMMKCLEKLSGDA